MNKQRFHLTRKKRVNATDSVYINILARSMSARVSNVDRLRDCKRQVEQKKNQKLRATYCQKLARTHPRCQYAKLLSAEHMTKLCHRFRVRPFDERSARAPRRYGIWVEMGLFVPTSRNPVNMQPTCMRTKRNYSR